MHSPVGRGFAISRLAMEGISLQSASGVSRGKFWRGDAVPLLEGIADIAGDRGWNEARFVGLGTNVIFAEDFRNPA